MNGISVIICCYNSAARLPETFKYLANQLMDDAVPWEIIIVNNASTDDTVATAKQWQQKLCLKASFTIVEEPQQGLSYARQRGVEEAKYEYLVFCDDDNCLCETYLQTAFSIMSEMPSIGALGGRCLPAADVSFPSWWEKNKNQYAVGTQKDHSGFASDRMYLWGAGLVTRKSVLKKIFDPAYPMLLTDRQGTNLSSGGDAEICARILLLNYQLYYDEHLLLFHFIPAERLTQNYLEKLRKGDIQSQLVLNDYREIIKSLKRSRAKKIKFLAASVFKLPLAYLRFSKKKKACIYKRLSADWNLHFLPAGSNFEKIKRFYTAMK